MHYNIGDAFSNDSQAHSEKKILSSTFWSFSFSEIEDSSQYLEETNSTWKDHDRNIAIIPALVPKNIKGLMVIFLKNKGPWE